MWAASSSSDAVQQQPQHKVFINYRGDELRCNFVSHLERALKRENINVFIDKDETKGSDLSRIFFQRIVESSIAIMVISSRYTESKWCMNELVKVKECVEAGTLQVFPVFYKVDVYTVKNQRGTFGDNLDDLIKFHPTKADAWTKALEFVTTMLGEKVEENSDEGEIVEKITKDLKEMLEKIPKGRESELARGKETEPSEESPTYFGIKTRLRQLKQKLELESENVTRFIGVVGMPGIGKTTIAKELFNDCGHRFLRTMFLDDVRRKSKTRSLRGMHEDLFGKEGKLNTSKVFIVLDDVSDKSQIDGILDGREWLKAGSKVVITTSSKSAIIGMVDDTYHLSGLSHIDALNYFCYHGFSNNIAPSSVPKFMKLATEFVDYSKGHPSALQLLARELRDKNESYWRGKLKTLANSPSSTIQDVLRIPYDELSEQHKNVFLDIASFFRFENETYARSLLDSEADNVSEIRDLADKFLINISGGRVEMNDLLYTFAMGLDSQASSEKTTSWRRLSNPLEIIALLKNKSGENKVRGIYLDLSQVTRKMSLHSDSFHGMENLRFLKFFNSECHKECEVDCKLYFPEGLEFALQELRYLHWLKFHLTKLPQDFDPKNLIDLKLPYSQIEQVWEDEKDTSKLQWLDLNHSSKLHSLSGLSHARNLQSMNLEGCTGLKTLPEFMQNMINLVFLNLRGCTSLQSLPDITLVSLRTLILSGCSRFKDFMVIAEKLEELYLDGTAIKGLPSTIGNLRSLISLKLKDCTKLLSLPDSIGNLQAIQELILSGCSSLASFPNVRQNLKHLKTLLLDGTAIKEMPDLLTGLTPDQGQTSSGSHCDLCEWPRGIYGLSSVRRLSLSRNNFTSLPNSICYLYHLKFLELKHCKKLVSVPMLPPNLQWLDAHGCISLEEISIPLNLLSLETDHQHSTYIFTNCIKLDQAVKNMIVSYARKKIHLMSHAQARYDKGFVLDVLIGICYPGWQIPVWFNYRSVDSEFKPNLPRHWNASGLTGIALCAVVSFKDYNAQNTRLLVTCSGEFKEEDEPLLQFSCILGGWTENGSYEPREIKSCHVFIGYTSWLHLKKPDNRRGCVATEASLKFQVTNGNIEVPNCKVLKCGFSLIYAPTSADHSLCTDTSYDVTPPTNGETSSSSIDSNGEIYYQQKSVVSSVLLVPPRRNSEIVEEATSFLARTEVVAAHEETIQSRKDDNEQSGQKKMKKLMGVTSGSTSSREETEEVVDKVWCFSFLHDIFTWLRLGRERGAAIEPQEEVVV